jgi:NitT/TauT family transport system ATP-binding protein
LKLEIQNVDKSFTSKNGSVLALKDVSFQVASGEFLCLLGPSGCGKSTLLNILAGLDTPDRGQVFANGVRVIAPGTDRVVMFQDATLFPWLNVIDNVAFGLAMHGTPFKERYEVADHYLQMVHLARFSRSAVHDLLHAELLDIWSTTRKTIVFVTHNVREAIRLGDRVLVMSARPGRVKCDFAINLPRPRAMEDHGLVDMARAILGELKDEVNRALALEVNGVHPDA